MKAILKKFLEKIDISYYERLITLSILYKQFSDARQVKQYGTREELWQSVFCNFSEKPISVLEFGVFEGYSIKQFASLNAHKESKFYGFDSFEGLPEDWIRNLKKREFDVNGNLPSVDDKRVTFIKGWFQNTLSNFLADEDLNETLFVHYDADIFSATLYTMLQIDTLKTPYYAVFDEFTGHETRALWRYMQISGAKVYFLGSVGDRAYPKQLSCKITPVISFSPW